MVSRSSTKSFETHKKKTSFARFAKLVIWTLNINDYILKLFFIMADTKNDMMPIINKYISIPKKTENCNNRFV